jgi:hypothetical protein
LGFESYDYYFDQQSHPFYTRSPSPNSHGIK